jgi:N-acetylmuramoyl-L-alanine amidase
MRRTFFVGFIALISIVASIGTSGMAWATVPASRLHVLIDPGHGGADSGATRGKIKESQIALQVSEKLRELLAADLQFQVSLTRTSDRFLTLKDRVEQIEETKADLFLSIHANSSSDRRARGVEFYFQNHLPPDEETLYLAATENRLERQLASTTESELEPTKKNDVLSIIEDLRRQTRMTSSLKLSDKLLRSWNRGSESPSKTESNTIRQAPFYVVSKAGVPSVLVELGFITNPKDADRLVDANYQQSIAERIYRGLREYKEMMDKTEPGPLKSSP